MTSYQKILEPSILLFAVILFFIVTSVKISIKNLVKFKSLVWLLSVIYFITTIILLVFTNYTKSTIGFLATFAPYPFILIYYHSIISSNLGIQYDSIAFGGLAKSSEAWIDFMACIPFVGILPITYRIYTQLVQLEEKIKSGEVKL